MPTIRQDQTITLTDGRTLGWCEYGDPTGVLVIALHGTPGSKLKYSGLDGVARSLGLRLISVDRWGYGLTSAKPGGTLMDFGQDMLALADQVGAGRCLVVGISGGGPYAVATAAVMGERAGALALVAPVGVIDAGTRLSVIHQICFRVAPHVPIATAGVFQLCRAGLRLASDLTMRIAFGLHPTADRRAIAEDAIRRRLATTFADGLRPGVQGPVTDVALFPQPWGIDWAAVSMPTRIWMGTEDNNVPAEAVRRLAAVMPRAELIELPGEGHLWVASHGDLVFEWLAQQGTTAVTDGAARSEPA